MYKIHHTTKDRFIVYNAYKSNKKNSPYVIFLHGLMSSMNGAKAIYLEQYCIEHDLNFIRFDNFGHGLSSQKFMDCTLSDWLEGLEMVLEHFAIHEFILVGSSLGGWLSLLTALKHKYAIKALICVSAAPDFTEESIWQHLAPIQKEKMQAQGWLEVSGRNCQQKYPISYNLIEDARNYLLLDQEVIDIDLPIHLIHGQQDVDVSINVATRLLQKLRSSQVVLKLIKDGEHNLSRPQDLKIIANSLDELLQVLNF